MAISRQDRRDLRIGVLSDTHGYLDPQVLRLFAGVSHIIHAGDVVSSDVLTGLETIAPVTAVAGNLDDQNISGGLPREAAAVVDGVRFVVGHKRKRLLKRLAQGAIVDGDVDLVVFGHDHAPSASWIDGVLHLNPGTASSPHEEDDAPTVAIVERVATGLGVFFIPLADRRD